MRSRYNNPYPEGFPNEAQANVEAAKIQARKAFGEAKKQLPENKWGSGREVTELLKQSIMSVFAVFAHEACELGRSGVWDVVLLHSHCEDFLDRFTDEVYADRGYDTNDHKMERDHLRTWDLMKCPEWDQYEDERFEVAKLQAGAASPPLAINISVSDDLKELRDERETNAASKPADGEEIARRKSLYAEYRDATGKPSSRSVYEGDNVPIHKPQFYAYLNGTLPSDSQTLINFERFLREKKPPTPKKPRG